MKRDFNGFMKKHKKQLFAIVKINCKYDAEGHCLLPSDDPWMLDETWDQYNERDSRNERKR